MGNDNLADEGYAMNEMGEKRLWKFLESFDERLTSIEDKLEKVVRLEVQVDHHGVTLSRYGNRLDKHDDTIHNVQLWQAEHYNRSSIDRLFNNMRTDLTALSKDFNSLNLNSSSDNGVKSVIAEIIKWISVILAAIVIYNLTGS